MREISGKEIAQKIINTLKSQPKPEKILAAVLVGKNPASIGFLNQKEKTAKELGVDFRIYNFPEEIKNDDLRKEVNRITSLKKAGGVIIQLPLPTHLNSQYILNVIPREKDIDVLGERALGAFYNDRNPVLPPAVGVVEEILKSYTLNLKSSKIAVVGLGFLIGKPIANWFMGKTKEIYLLDEGSDFEALKQADLVISGVGKAGLIKPEMLKNDAMIIDFGYSTNKEGKIQGDFNASEIENYLPAEALAKAGKLEIRNLSYTPTPSGTGPILVAKIFENFYKLNSNS